MEQLNYVLPRKSKVNFMQGEKSVIYGTKCSFQCLVERCYYSVKLLLLLMSLKILCYTGFFLPLIQPKKLLQQPLQYFIFCKVAKL